MVEKSIQDTGLALGFDLAGIARADDEKLLHARILYESWLGRGDHASMQFLVKHREKKFNLRALFPQAKSVICVGMAYEPYSHWENESDEMPKISSYTASLDYHRVFEARLESFAVVLGEKFGAKTFLFADRHPVAERFWGARAGLGWIGKNSMLIHQKKGSYFFLGGLITDLDLQPDDPDGDHCGKCTRCVDACPTDAIQPNRTINSNRCIAYHTIENRSEVPEALAEKFGTWIAGCDICQTVCPWNSRKPRETQPSPMSPLLGKSFLELANWTEIEFSIYNQHFSTNRIRYKAFQRNLEIAVKNSRLRVEDKNLVLNRLKKTSASLN